MALVWVYAFCGTLYIQEQYAVNSVHKSVLSTAAVSPLYDRHGWLGINNQLSIYLLLQYDVTQYSKVLYISYATGTCIVQCVFPGPSSVWRLWSVVMLCVACAGGRGQRLQSRKARSGQVSACLVIPARTTAAHKTPPPPLPPPPPPLATAATKHQINNKAASDRDDTVYML